jgi:iron-sulfur cluster assembly protein
LPGGKKMAETIKKTDTIGDAVRNFPSIIPVFQKYGLSCIGCSVQYDESIEQGAKGHGMEDQIIESMISEANKAISSSSFATDSEISVSDSAITKIKEFISKNSKEGAVFRIGVMPGGCSGNSYKFSIEPEQKETDKCFQFGELKIVVDKQSLDILKGSKIDFIDSLEGSGFKITNPSAQSTCGCGSSFA